MPVFKSFHIDASKVIIWHITEEEAYFASQSGLESTQNHLKKRLEYLSSRYCLKLLIPDINFGDIVKDKEGKPYLHNQDIHFSISHSYPYVAVAVNREQTLGIDIQTIQDKILRLQHKFLSEQEQQKCGNFIPYITAAWCCKEAMFKKYALGGLDFKNNMPLSRFNIKEGKTGHATINFNKDTTAYKQELYIELEEEYVLAITND